MPSQTFMNLPAEKKARITQALLNEYSRQPLAQAQVTPIVKDAQIARGAFYKYFEDQKDAYNYLYQEVLKEVHNDTPRIMLTADTVALFVNQTAKFLSQASNSQYRELIKMHIIYNAAFLNQKPMPIEVPPKMWAVASLCHQTIHDVFLNPECQDAALKRLQISLEALV